MGVFRAAIETTPFPRQGEEVGVRIVQPGRFVRQPVHLVRPIQVTPYHAVPESRRMPIIQSAPAVTQPVGQPVRSAPVGPSVGTG